MEQAVIAALVSGAVSVIGVFVSLYIASRARRTELAKLRLTASLQAADKTVATLKQYAASIERARIACWRLITDLREIAAPRGAITARYLLSVMENTRGVFVEFEDKWAETKPNVPIEIVDYIRKIRHDARHNVSAVLNYLHFMAEESEARSAVGERFRVIRELDVTVHQLLEQLEHLFRAVSTATRIAAGELSPEFSAPELPKSGDSKAPVIAAQVQVRSATLDG